MPRSDYRITRGAQFLLSNGQPAFSPNPVCAIATYRTIFGPIALTRALVLARTTHNMNYGLRRTLCVRNPADGGILDARLRATQMALGSVEWFCDLRQMLVRMHANACDGYTSWVDDAIRIAQQDHPKRQMRMDYMTQLAHGGDLGGAPHQSRSHAINMKHPEAAKEGKFIRTTVDLGLPSWALACGLAERMKCPLQVEFQYKGFTIVFCSKSRYDMLSHHFTRLIDPPGRGYFVFFSDDSCLSVRVGNTVRWFNIDISSCDTSHTPLLFDLLQHITPARGASTMRLCIDQLRVAMRVRNPERPEQRMHIAFPGGFMKSGWCFTTMINNLATVLLFAGMVHNNDWTPDGLVTGAACAGYLIDRPPILSHPSEIQFLKHSPVLQGDGKYVSVPNLGPLLRVSGTAYGELSPALGRTVQERALAAQDGYCRSAFYAVRCPTLTARLGHPMVTDRLAHHHSARTLTYANLATDADLFVRYGMSPEEQCSFFRCIFGAPGESHHGAWVDRIMKADYGLAAFQL